MMIVQPARFAPAQTPGSIVPALSSASQGGYTTNTWEGPTNSWLPFDGNDSTAYQSTTVPAWISVTLPAVKIANRYTMKCLDISDTPKTWTISGYDGSSWITLDTHTNYTWASSSVLFTMSNTVAYIAYRIDITAYNNAAWRLATLDLAYA